MGGTRSCKGATCAKNGIEGEDYVVTRCGRVPTTASDRGDLAVPAEDASSAGSKDAPAAAVTAAREDKAAALAKAPAKVNSVRCHSKSSSKHIYSTYRSIFCTLAGLHSPAFKA